MKAGEKENQRIRRGGGRMARKKKLKGRKRRGYLSERPDRRSRGAFNGWYESIELGANLESPGVNGKVQ